MIQIKYPKILDLCLDLIIDKTGTTKEIPELIDNAIMDSDQADSCIFDMILFYQSTKNMEMKSQLYDHGDLSGYVMFCEKIRQKFKNTGLAALKRLTISNRTAVILAKCYTIAYHHDGTLRAEILR